MSNFLDLEFTESPVHRLGSKINGRVFRGTFKSEAVAVKKLSPEINVPQDDQHWEKLIKLVDDHIVKYQQLSLQKEDRYLVMELCQGSMEDYCRNTLDKSVASYIKGIDIMWQLAYVIDYLHRLGVNPGDLMLENVLLWKKNPESRRVFVKLSGYGYSNNRFENNDDNANLIQIGCLFYSAATKEETKPNGNVSLDNLIEIDPKHQTLALDLINFLFNETLSNNFEVGTLLRHPLFTRCTEKGRSRLKKDLKNETKWNSEEMLQNWKESRDSSGESNFPGEVFDDFKDILLSNNKDITSLVDEAFETTPQLFSEYIWQTAIASGSVLNGNNQTIPIEKQQVLGQGTYGKVYKSEYTDRNGKTYLAAYKKCNPKPEAEEIFHREIDTFRKLCHLFVVKYLDVIGKDSKKYIVMELCDGSLKDYFEGKLDRIPKETLNEKILISQIALGLAYIHGEGIIHKDLKLDNILLKRQSPRLVLAKIADFGFAKELKPGKFEFSKTAHPGTETYMAPELLNAPEGAYPATFASDVYALGITIARICLKGEHPFSNYSLRRKLSMAKGMVPQNLQGLSWDLIDLILKLTDKEPEKRPEIVIALRHPYFVLTNDRTKKHFVDQLWEGFKSLSQEDRSKQGKKIFSNRNFQEWYRTLSQTKPETAEEKEEVEKTLLLFRGLGPDVKADTLYPAKKYEKMIKEEITSKYDPDVENQINQMSLISLIRGRFRGLSRCRLYKMIQRSPKLLVPYFWSHLLDVVNESVINPKEPLVIPACPGRARLHMALSKHTIIPELEWSSLYFDEEEVVDELWNIKYSENYENSPETIQEIIKIVAKCNVSEKVWSDLLDKIGTKHGLSLLAEIVVSHSPNAPKFTEMILQRFVANKMSPQFHILAASNEGDWAAEITKILFKYVHPGNAVDKIGKTPVHHAAENESSSGPKLMKLLLENGGNPNFRFDLEKPRPINLAASNQGDYAADILKLLLEKGGTCDTLIDRFEPIHLATMNRGECAPEMLDLLLEKRGIKIVHKDTGMSLVHFAMFNNGDCGLKIAKKLLDNGANPNTRDKKKQTPLHLAARDIIGENNQIAIMTIFLENGGDPNAVDEFGRTPVHYAAANEGEYAHEKLKVLLNHGGKLNISDKEGLSPIHYTIVNNGTFGEEMRELVGYKKNSNVSLSSGAEIWKTVDDKERTNIPLDNNSGETLLHRLANGCNDQIHLVQMALDNGEDPNAKDSLGCSSVHVAVAEIESSVGLDILELLLRKGGDPNLPNDSNKRTPVHYAASSLKEWGPKQMEILLKNGGNANAITKAGYTPLHLAAMNPGMHGPKLTNILLKHGGNSNALDKFGRSPVHIAIQNKNDQLALVITKQLLEKGGDANIRDKDGRTPLHYNAIAEKPNSLLRGALLKHGGNNLEKDNDGMTPFSLRMTKMKKIV